VFEHRVYISALYYYSFPNSYLDFYSRSSITTMSGSAMLPLLIAIYRIASLPVTFSDRFSRSLVLF